MYSEINFDGKDSALNLEVGSWSSKSLVVLSFYGLPLSFPSGLEVVEVL